MSEHFGEPVNQSGPPGTYGCACAAAGARLCYLIRCDVDAADDDLDDGTCDCLCHRWRANDETDEDND